MESSSPVKSQEALCPHVSPSIGICSWGAVCLGLCIGRRFGGGHDLHVLGEDGLKCLVSVDHGTKHQRLEETEIKLINPSSRNQALYLNLICNSLWIKVSNEYVNVNIYIYIYKCKYIYIQYIGIYTQDKLSISAIWFGSR